MGVLSFSYDSPANIMFYSNYLFPQSFIYSSFPSFSFFQSTTMLQARRMVLVVSNPFQLSKQLTLIPQGIKTLFFDFKNASCFIFKLT